MRIKTNRTRFLNLLILLTPIPFGCVGRVFSPIFYILLLVFVLTSLGEAGREPRFLYRKYISKIFYIFLGILAIQLIPLPFFLVKLVSPHTARYLALLKDAPPAFASLSLVPAETLLFSFKFLVFALFFWTLLRIKFTKHDMISIIKALTLSAALQTLFGLIKYVQGNRLFFLFFHPVPKDDPLLPFLTGTLGNPNHFAFYLEMILPLALVLFFHKLQFLEPGMSLREKFLAAVDTNKGILGYFVAVVLMGVGILLTRSRAGTLALILSFLVFSLFSIYLKSSRAMRKKMKYFFIGITLLAMLLGVQDTVNEFMSTSFESHGRFLRWPATLEMVRDFPLLGTGFGTYRYAFFLYDRDVGAGWSTHAHNDYLEAAAEGGLPGSLVLIILFGFLFFSFLKMWLERKHPDVKIIGLGIIAAFFAVGLHSIFDFSLHVPANMLIFVIILALGIKIATYKREFPS